MDHRLVFGVDRGERLVEDQDRRVAQQGAGDRQALALAAGEQHAAFADHRGVALRQGRDELVRVGAARRGFDFGAVGVRLAEPKVLLDRAVEQVGVLMNDGDHPPQCLGIERLQILPADPHGPLLRVEEAQEQPRHRRFARAARPDDADLAAGGDGEGKPVMGRTPPAGISEINILEGDGRKQRPVRLRWARLVRGHQRLGGEKRVDAGGRGLPEHPLMQHGSEVAQGAEHLGSRHQHDQQRLHAHLAVRHPPHSERQGSGGADRHPAIGNATGHHTHRNHPQRAVAQLARPIGEPAAIGRTLAERLQGRQALDTVEELRAEGFEGPLAPVAGAALDLEKDCGGDQGHERESEHHRGDRHVPEGDEGEDCQRSQHRDRQLRNVLTEEGLQLLDAVDDRQHDAAGALAGEPSRPECGNLVVEAAA